jgi:hypothetical protein
MRGIPTERPAYRVAFMFLETIMELDGLPSYRLDIKPRHEERAV